MKKNQILGLIRNVLLAVSGVVTYYLNKEGIAEPFSIANIVNASFALIVLIWGVADKSLKGFSYVSSIVRSVFSLASGVLMGFGATNEVLELLPLISGVVLSVISSFFSVQVNGSIDEEIKRIEESV